MASNFYTLPELVDLALKTPEVGAVNFNILRIILHKILVECKLQNVTGEWKPVPLPSAAHLLVEEKFPDHPLLGRIIEEKERSSKSATPIEKEELKLDEETSSESEDEAIQRVGEIRRRDTAVLVKIPEPETDSLKTGNESEQKIIYKH